MITRCLLTPSDATELLVSVTNYENPALPYDSQVPPETRKYSIQYWISQCLFRYGICGNASDMIIDTMWPMIGHSPVVEFCVMVVTRSVMNMELCAQDLAR